MATEPLPGPAPSPGELDPAALSYGPTGIHHEQPKLDHPFAVDLGLT
ncbi:hypothetical protein [Kitasatospora sp. NPDC050463]